MTAHNPLPVYDHCLRCGGRCVQLSTGQWRHVERYDESLPMLDEYGDILTNLTGHPVWQEAEPR